MPYLVDTDVLVDVSRNLPGAIGYVDRLDNDWAMSAMTALELISGAKKAYGHSIRLSLQRR